MGESQRSFVKVALRYLILALIAIPGLDLFYYIFQPLTTYPTYWILDLFYDPILLNNSLFFGTRIIEIIGACVAGSAYYFLLILNLTTPCIKNKNRIKLLLFTFGTFYLINLLRIILLSFMYLEGSSSFDLAHKLFWYMGSTLFVVIIWFLGVYLFKVEKIPFFSDLKYIYGRSSLNKKGKKNLKEC